VGHIEPVFYFEINIWREIEDVGYNTMSFHVSCMMER